MKYFSILFFILLMSGCTTIYKSYQFGPLTNSYWDNQYFSHLSQEEIQLEFSKVKGACNVEAYKLPVPSPSCVQPPMGNCTGKTGFALGFCQSYTPPMRCDYSAVNIAKQARIEIFTSCMLAKGWQLNTTPGPGSDSSGGVFEHVAYDNNADYFVKKGTFLHQGQNYTAVVRRNPKNSSSSAHQGIYAFDDQNNTLRVDSEPPLVIEENSAAKFILKRLRELR